MKLISYLTIVIMLSFSVISFASDGVKQKGTLLIKFNGLNSEKGNVIIAVCNSSENYKDNLSPFIGKTVKIEKNSAVLEIDDLPFGEYAVKAFHDEDANNDLNTNFLGIPVENYGFSNNARGMFGPPSWNDAKFKFNYPNKTIEIEIK